MENNQKMLEKLSKDEEFMKKLGNAVDPEQLQKAFGEYGVQITLEEAAQVIENAKALPDNELTEDDLDAVSGGILVSTLGGWLICCAVVYAAATFGKIALNRRRR